MIHVQKKKCCPFLSLDFCVGDKCQMWGRWRSQDNNPPHGCYDTIEGCVLAKGKRIDPINIDKEGNVIP